MSRRLAQLCCSRAAGLRQLFASSSHGSIGQFERAAAVCGTRTLNALNTTPICGQVWRGFASEADSAQGFDEFDYISYPMSKAFVGQMAPDFEAPGNTAVHVSICSEMRTSWVQISSIWVTKLIICWNSDPRYQHAQYPLKHVTSANTASCCTWQQSIHLLPTLSSVFSVCCSRH